MSFNRIKIAFVFYDVTDPEAARVRFETALGLRVIENRFHPPHHHHGLVKYDAGAVILALNQIKPQAVMPQAPDGLVTVLHCGRGAEKKAIELGFSYSAEGGGTFTDPDYHLFSLLQSGSDGASGVGVTELRLVAEDLNALALFYGEQLGLELLGRGTGWVRFAAGGVALVVAAPSGVGGQPPCKQGYLIVLATWQIETTVHEMVQRGVVFQGPVSQSAIGKTARLNDPVGYPLCLYEPSEEALRWESGPKLRAILEEF